MNVLTKTHRNAANHTIKYLSDIRDSKLFDEDMEFISYLISSKLIGNVDIKDLKKLTNRFAMVLPATTTDIKVRLVDIFEKFQRHEDVQKLASLVWLISCNLKDNGHYGLKWAMINDKPTSKFYSGAYIGKSTDPIAEIEIDHKQANKELLELMLLSGDVCLKFIGNSIDAIIEGIYDDATDKDMILKYADGKEGIMVEVSATGGIKLTIPLVPNTECECGTVYYRTFATNANIELIGKSMIHARRIVMENRMENLPFTRDIRHSLEEMDQKRKGLILKKYFENKVLADPNQISSHEMFQAYKFLYVASLNCINANYISEIGLYLHASTKKDINAVLATQYKDDDNAFASIVSATEEIFVTSGYGDADRRHATIIGVAKDIKQIMDRLASNDIEEYEACLLVYAYTKFLNYMSCDISFAGNKMDIYHVYSGMRITTIESDGILEYTKSPYIIFGVASLTDTGYDNFMYDTFENGSETYINLADMLLNN